MNLPTKKQMDFIRDISSLVNVKFDGKTKKDASEYISKHIDRFKQLQEAEAEASLPSYIVEEYL